MTRVVPVPQYLDDHTIDVVAAGLAPWPPTERLLIDAHATEWSSPAGFTALLTLGAALADIGAPTPELALPSNESVASYWAKVGFIAQAEELFQIHGKVPRRRAAESSDTLLRVTMIRNATDVHDVVEGVTHHTTQILMRELELESSVVGGFSQSLSEACQNIVEHSGAPGWVAAHVYVYRRRLNGRKVAVIAVSDAGMGFRRSLEPTQGKRFGERWSDAQAIETALIHGISRFRDPGRGLGLNHIKRYLSRWDGKISIRSGTARVAIVPPWDDELPRSENLPWFPGSQVTIVVPGKVAA